MSKNKLIVKNTLFLATRTLLALFISFYTTRIVLHELGVSDYGLFSVIYGTVAFFIFIVSAMNDSVQRFISIGLGEKNVQNIKDTVFNSIIIYIVCGLFFLVMLFCFRHVIVGRFLNIQPGSLHTANYVFIIAIFSIFTSIIQTPFNAMVLAHEKMSFYAYMAIFDSISKLAISFFLVHMSFNKLIVYTLLLLASSFISFNIYVLYCYRSFKTSLLGGKLNYSIIKEIASFSFWNTFGNFAYVCRTQGINIAINIFFATFVNAAYALSSTILSAINSLTQSLVSAIRPQIFKSYAENNSHRYISLVMHCSKYTFSFLFTLSCPILICTNELLSIWLVDIPQFTVGFVRYVIIVALIDSFSSSIIAGVQATGRIRNYQLIVSFFVFISLPISFLLFKYGYPPYSIFFPLIITSSINLILRASILSYLTKFDVKEFIKSVVTPCLLSAFLSLAISFFINNYFIPTNIIFVLALCCLYGLISILFIFIFVVSRTEKKIIYEYVRGNIY
ncbi:MATE family efflux transporter [Klebsiella pneumoniae]